ncbi:probable mitogen-activated protein kinase kinase kinase 9 at C-terminar half [Coccomyxa sp. Obi]|nr:probable mitogen-activated protein kinase kinase kinase 9 at C-terminar half [Coccomyxa sp. Obi]
MERRRHPQAVPILKTAACQTITQEVCLQMEPGSKQRPLRQRSSRSNFQRLPEAAPSRTRKHRKGCGNVKGPDTPDLDAAAAVSDSLHLRLLQKEARKRKQPPQAADGRPAPKKARTSRLPATPTSSQRKSKVAKRSPKQIAAQRLADAHRRNADLVRQLQDAKACTERLSEAAETEVIKAREGNASLTKDVQRLELQKQDLLKKLAHKDKELEGADARITHLQQEVARLQGDNAMLQSRLGNKSGDMDSGASEALHTAQDCSETAGAEDKIKHLQQEVDRLQHDKSLMQSHLEDMSSNLEEAEERAERLAAVQENATLPCFPAGATVQTHQALGMGSSGTVFKATLTQPVAIKRANRRASKSGGKNGTPEDAAADRVAQDNVDFEARMLAIFKGHPDIVQALGLIQEAGALGRSIVLELASHGSLASLLDQFTANNLDMDFTLQLDMARCCASGLQHIHDRSMCHNDFKPDNVLVFVEKDGSCSAPGGSPLYRLHAKVADLGLMAKCDRRTGRLLEPWMAAGTKGYQHPGSLLDPTAAGFADDRYAYGVMLWEMLGGQCARQYLANQLDALEDLSPDQWAIVEAELARRGWDVEDMDQCVAVAHGFGFISLEEIQLKQGTDAPQEYIDLVKRLVSVDPRSEGPSWSEVLDTLDRLLTAAT